MKDVGKTIDTTLLNNYSILHNIFVNFFMWIFFSSQVCEVFFVKLFFLHKIFFTVLWTFLF